MHYSKRDILNLDKISRLNLINSVTGIKPANLIGTLSKKGIENLAIFSSVVHMGSNPAIIGFMTRPVDVVPRDTYQNIIETGYYTINHIHFNQIKQAHYTSAKFEASISEFEKCGFSSEYKNDFHAPFVKDSNCQIGLKLKEIIPIKINDTALVIGEVEHVHVAEESISDDLQLNLDNNQSVGISGLNRYYSLNLEQELPYARVKDLPQF
jgi:flavin reductase (DIM6/NTAB) family NADH-FMN oxidoreductase RutF